MTYVVEPEELSSDSESIDEDDLRSIEVFSTSSDSEDERHALTSDIPSDLSAGKYYDFEGQRTLK